MARSDGTDDGGARGQRGPRAADALTCSFCGTSQRQVKRLSAGAAGGGVGGGCGALCLEMVEEDRETESAEQDIVTGSGPLPTPHEIFAHLSRYVVGQDGAKRALAVAVHNHY